MKFYKNLEDFQEAEQIRRIKLVELRRTESAARAMVELYHFTCSV
jgi:hypothetical protein